MMRPFSSLLGVFVLCGSFVLCRSASAGFPDPSRSSYVLSAQPASCQWRFRNDGTFDTLTLRVTVRDFADSPVASCSTSCNLDPITVAKSCGGNRKVIRTDANGAAHFVYRCIGGHGTIQLRVTAQCSGSIGLGSRTITFTNPDLDGSRDTDGGATNVVDLGIWASGLSTYQVASDFDCNGTVNVVDLGLFATGLGKTCNDCH